MKQRDRGRDEREREREREREHVEPETEDRQTAHEIWTQHFNLESTGSMNILRLYAKSHVYVHIFLGKKSSAF